MLAEYVIALLKHDKSSADLKELCLSQLVDFLKDQTNDFVDALFGAVATKSYLVERRPSVSVSSLAAAQPSASEPRRRMDSDGEEDDDDRNFKHRRSDSNRMDTEDDRDRRGGAIESYEGNGFQGQGNGFQKRRRDDTWDDNRPGKMMRGPPRGGFNGPPPFDRRWGGPMPPSGGFDMGGPSYFRGGSDRGFRGGARGFRGGPDSFGSGGGRPQSRGRCFDYDRGLTKLGRRVPSFFSHASST